MCAKLYSATPPSRISASLCELIGISIIFYLGVTCSGGYLKHVSNMPLLLSCYGTHRFNQLWNVLSKVCKIIFRPFFVVIFVMMLLPWMMTFGLTTRVLFQIRTLSVKISLLTN